MADGMVVWKGFLIILLLGCLRAQDQNCDFQANVVQGVTYVVKNPEYPSNYPAGRQCRWIAYCPQGYNCRLDCPVINIPNSQGCTVDRLLISRSGDPYLTGADKYCSYGSLSNIVSTGNTLSVGLISSSNSPGGYFYCTLQAQLAQTPPSTCSCGYKKTNRIVGGVQTGVNEFPMMAGLVDVYESVIKCGAVIVTNRAVLSAAHCVAGKQDSIRAVVVGEHDVTVGDSPATKVYQISSFTIHPQYSTASNDYDIALVNTMQDIAFSDRVGPVCLPFKFAASTFAGQTVTALGWGTTFIGGPTSNYLQKVDLQVITQTQCQSMGPGFTLTARQMCTYTPGKDACQDDSGGPLLYTDPATGLLFHTGIISSGMLCANRGSPGINTRVTQFLSWIQANTNGYNFCVK